MNKSFYNPNFLIDSCGIVMDTDCTNLNDYLPAYYKTSQVKKIIAPNDDLNNYIAPGIYCVRGNDAPSINNRPKGLDSAFELEVSSWENSGTIIIQTIRGLQIGLIAQRYLTSDTNIWSKWASKGNCELDWTATIGQASSTTDSNKNVVVNIACPLPTDGGDWLPVSVLTLRTNPVNSTTGLVVAAFDFTSRALNSAIIQTQIFCATGGKNFTAYGKAGWRRITYATASASTDTISQGTSSGQTNTGGATMPGQTNTGGATMPGSGGG